MLLDDFLCGLCNCKSKINVLDCNTGINKIKDGPIAFTHRVIYEEVYFFKWEAEQLVLTGRQPVGERFAVGELGVAVGELLGPEQRARVLQSEPLTLTLILQVPAVAVALLDVHLRREHLPQ